MLLVVAALLLLLIGEGDVATAAVVVATTETDEVELDADDPGVDSAGVYSMCYTIQLKP